MKSVLAWMCCICPWLALAAGPPEVVDWSPWHARPVLVAQDNVIDFQGPIHADSARAILALLTQGRFDTLRIQSTDGDLFAARSLGQAVFEHQIHVVVSGPCVELCANYVFTAGRQRSIEERGFVLFRAHADFQNCVAQIERLSALQRQAGDAALSADEQRMLTTGTRWLRLNTDYFSRMGVDASLLSVGYQAGHPVSEWILSPQHMARLGMAVQQVPADYASPAFCARLRLQSAVHPDVQCL
jgi:hypothetical protein